MRAAATQASRKNEPRAGTLGFLGHLEELRTRVIRSFIAIAVGVVCAFLFVDRIANFILEPTYRLLPAGATLIFTRPGEAFSFNLDVALIAGMVLSAPFVMYEVWRFIAPGLYAKERKFVLPFLLLTTTSTLCGAAFSHYVLFPSMIMFFGTFASSKIKFMPRVEDTFELYKMLLIGMVVVFQMPAFAFLLAKAGVITARMLVKNIKYAILIIFIVAAVITPTPDPWNQTVFAAPMIALYMIGIGIAWLVGRTRKNPVAKPADQGTALLTVVGKAPQNEPHDRNRG